MPVLHQDPTHLYPVPDGVGGLGHDSTACSIACCGSETRAGGPFSAAWRMAAGLLQPIFDGGQLSAQRRAAIDRYNAALARARAQRLMDTAQLYLALGGTPLAGAGGRPQHGPIRSPQ